MHLDQRLALDGERGYKMQKTDLKTQFLIVDEASMIGNTSSLLDDLMQYVFSGKIAALF